MKEIEFSMNGVHTTIPKDMGDYIVFYCPHPDCKDLEIRMDKETEQIKTVGGKGNKYRHSGSFLFRNQ